METMIVPQTEEESIIEPTVGESFEFVQKVETVKDGSSYHGSFQMRTMKNKWRPWKRRYGVIARCTVSDGVGNNVEKMSRRSETKDNDRNMFALHVFTKSSCEEEFRHFWLFFTSCSFVNTVGKEGSKTRSRCLSLSALRVSSRLPPSRSKKSSFFLPIVYDTEDPLSFNNFSREREEQIQIWCDDEESRNNWYIWFNELIKRAKERIFRISKNPECLAATAAAMQAMSRTGSGGDSYSKVCNIFQGSGAAPLVITPARSLPGRPYVNPPTEVSTAPRAIVVTTFGAFDVGFFDKNGSPVADPREALRVETSMTEVIRFSIDPKNTEQTVRDDDDERDVNRVKKIKKKKKSPIKVRRVLNINMPDVEMYSNVLDVMGMPL